jgi:predicted RNase H-like nuclease
LQLRLALTDAQRDDLLADAGGDRLDAVLCALQAAWASRQPRHGLPEHVDPLEGWIATA